MKLYVEPIQTKGDPLVAGFHWRGRAYLVRAVADRWILRVRWWSAEEQRSYFLVCAEIADTEGYYEICHSTLRGWLLIGVYD